MTDRIKKNGFTLVEILITVSVIVLLAAIVAGLVTDFLNQTKQKKTEAAFGILKAALQDFKDYGYKYYDLAPPANRDYPFYTFPLDCNGFDLATTTGELKVALGLTVAPDDVIINPNPNPSFFQFSGNTVMYFLLSRVPANREILEKLDKSLVTNLNTQTPPQSMSITIVRNGVQQIEPLYRVVDGWGTTLRYYYYDRILPANIIPNPYTRKSFPMIISAGPDKDFGDTDPNKRADNLTNQ